MYGQFQHADGRRGFCEPFASPDDFRSLREYFRTSHTRTFRAGLAHRIADQDPEYSCLKDGNGAWLDAAADAALMCPLLEMAGFERVRYNDRVLYIYNSDNPLSFHNLDRARQVEQFAVVSRKRPFARVNDYRGSIPRAVGAPDNLVAEHATRLRQVGVD